VPLLQRCAMAASTLLEIPCCHCHRRPLERICIILFAQHVVVLGFLGWASKRTGCSGRRHDVNYVALEDVAVYVFRSFVLTDKLTEGWFCVELGLL